jgi:hypothetical protein
MLRWEDNMKAELKEILCRCIEQTELAYDRVQ